MHVVNVSGYLLLQKNGKDFYNDFKHIFNYMS